MSLKRILEAKGSAAFLGDKILRPKQHVKFNNQVPSRSSPQFMGMAFDHAFRAGLRSRFEAYALGLVELASAILADSADSAARDRLQRRFQGAGEAIASIGHDLTDTQARACFHLAGFEVLYRSGYSDRLEYEPTRAELDELRQLFEIVPWEEFAPQVRLILNPSFNEGSRLVRGADADFVVDNMLVDVKTVSDSSASIARIRQVACYALLANHFGITGLSSEAEITRVGIYFSRSGVLASWPLEDVVPPEKAANIVAWLTSGGTNVAVV